MILVLASGKEDTLGLSQNVKILLARLEITASIVLEL